MPNSGRPAEDPTPTPPQGEGTRRPWAAYAMEGLGLAVFMLFASSFTMLLFHPDSPVGRAIQEPSTKYFILAFAMFPVILFGIVTAPWGKRTGAHINPAVTLAFWRLGKMEAFDAAGYIVGQFSGAILMVGLVALVAGKAYSHPAIDFAATKPGPEGTAVAFAIEFTMTFVLMMLLLWASNDERLVKKLPLFTSLLIAFYLTSATPHTGMSLNPARSFASALYAHDRPSLWIYFVAPVAATLLAAEIYRRCWPDRLGGPSYPPPPEPS